MIFTKPILVASVFCLISLMYVVIAFYGLSVNAEKQINRVFFCMCMSLAVWSGCYSFATIAVHAEAALLYNKISVLGWGFFYTLMYHFTLLLFTNDKHRNIFFYSLLYAPACILVSGFCISYFTGSQEFNMIHTSYGWTSVAPRTPLNVLLNVYACLYSLFILKNFLVWYKTIGSKRLLLKIKIIIIVSTLALFVGILTDLIIIRFMRLPFIQMIVIWLSAPICIIFSVLVQERIIYPVKKPNQYEIMNQLQRETLFHISGYVYIASMYAFLLMCYISKACIQTDQILFSLVLFFVGVFHFLIAKMVKNQQGQYWLWTFCAIAMLSFFSFHHITYYLITVWGLFFCYLAVTTVFEQGIYGYILLFFMIALQMFQWHYVPCRFVYFKWRNYSVRILIIFAASVIVFYINKLYRNKIKESVLQAYTHEFITKISHELVDINLSNYKTILLRILETGNEHFSCKSSYYCAIETQTKKVRALYFTDEKKNAFLRYTQVPLLFFSKKWFAAVIEGNYLAVLDINESEKNNIQLKRLSKERNVLGFYAFPVITAAETRGILIFEFSKQQAPNLLFQYKDLLTTLMIDVLNKLYYELELFQRANFDVITGLKNRECFSQELNGLLSRNTVTHGILLFLDIKHLKSINDAFGYAFGDEMLRRAGERLKVMEQNGDMIARFNGDEFVIFHSSDKPEQAKEIEIYIRLVIDLFKPIVCIKDNEFKIDIDIGVACFPDDGNTVDDLLRNANLALYQAQHKSQLGYHICNEQDKTLTLENAHYKNKLFGVLANNELQVLYQPQIDCTTNEVIGAEALVRWMSPQFGMVSPVKFIPILEHSGLIVNVGEWIMEESILQHKRLVDMGFPDVRMSINLSAVQFQHIRLIDTIKKLIKRYDVNPAALEFEITESATINNYEFVIDSFNKIRELGCSIAIDDFGVEFSSLNRLQALPINRLKIDKSFIDGIGINEKNEVIVQIIIELAKALKVRSIAEGVEKSGQIDFLRSKGCTEIQGYYYAKPMPADEFEAFVKNYA